MLRWGRRDAAGPSELALVRVYTGKGRIATAGRRILYAFRQS
jgi:hypothetical protein